MFDAELRRLRQHNDSIARMLDDVEEHLAQPLPSEPPFQVLSDVVLLQDRVYEMARMAGDLKRRIRDMVLQHTLAADFTGTKT